MIFVLAAVFVSIAIFIYGAVTGYQKAPYLSGSLGRKMLGFLSVPFTVLSVIGMLLPVVANIDNLGSGLLYMFTFGLLYIAVLLIPPLGFVYLGLYFHAGYLLGIRIRQSD